MPTTSTTHTGLTPDCAHPADPELLNRLFTHGRTFSHWLPRPVDDALLMRAWNLCKLGPTSANCQPLRILFERMPNAKAQLKDCLAPGNVDKTLAAPVTALFAADTRFYDHFAATLSACRCAQLVCRRCPQGNGRCHRPTQ